MQYFKKGQGLDKNMTFFVYHEECWEISLSSASPSSWGSADKLTDRSVS